VKKIDSEWNVYRTRFLIKAKKLSKPYKFVDALGREHEGKKGDYLMEWCDGMRRIAPKKIFEDVYVPMDAVGPDDVVIVSPLKKVPGNVRAVNQKPAPPAQRLTSVTAM